MQQRGRYGTPGQVVIRYVTQEVGIETDNVLVVYPLEISIGLRKQPSMGVNETVPIILVIRRTVTHFIAIVSLNEKSNCWRMLKVRISIKYLCFISIFYYRSGVTVSVSGTGCPGGVAYGSEEVRIRSPGYAVKYGNNVSHSFCCAMKLYIII